MNGLMQESVQRVGSLLSKKLRDADLRRRPPTDCITIFRVPDRIRKFDADAYEPKLVSIGPYHRGNPRLQPMDEFKLQCTTMILRRNSNTVLVLERYVAEIKSVELEARSFYSEDTNNIGTDEFVMMMLLDGCFIVQLLLMHYGDERNEEKNKVMWEHMNRLGMPALAADMIMLENQIPFFVIQKIFDLAGGCKEASLVTLALRFLRGLIPLGLEYNKPVHHLLHLFHARLMPTRPPEPAIQQAFDCNMTRLRWVRPSALEKHKSTITTWCVPQHHTDPEQPLLVLESVPSATELDQAGVKFRRKDNVECFLDISFNGRTLEIPQLLLFDNTVLILRNLVAFEQCSRKIAGSYVTTYSVFMDYIINTAEDVALLHSKGVIFNFLGNNEDGAVLFNKLCKGVVTDYDEWYLADVFHDLRTHCRSRRNQWRAKLMRDYFNNPWSLLSLLGAFVLLILTALQTGYSIQAYYHPKS